MKCGFKHVIRTGEQVAPLHHEKLKWWSHGISTTDARVSQPIARVAGYVVTVSVKAKYSKYVT